METSPLSLILTILLIIAVNYSVLSQTDSIVVNTEVILVNSESMDCDNSYDPYLLKSRITNIDYVNQLMEITINFTDNCCAHFSPSIEFRNDTLILIPYTELSDIHCTCDCCFTIKYIISGLMERNYTTLFREKEIVHSDYHYKIMEPTYDIYKGEKINQTNLYGFEEGFWIEFYEDSTIKHLSKYQDQSYRFRPRHPIWSKYFYPSGAPKNYERNDTTQMWFEDGAIKYESIDYKIGDTSFDYVISLHNDRTLKHKSLRKFFPTFITSEYDTCYSIPVEVSKIVYSEQYYENGERKELYSNDTTYKWFANGQLEQARSKLGRINYSENGHIEAKAFYWKIPGIECMGDLSHNLWIEYFPNGNIRKIRYKRDEIREDGHYRAKNYSWLWDDQMNVQKSPINWNEPFPWRKFGNLRIRRKMIRDL